MAPAGLTPAPEPWTRRVVVVGGGTAGLACGQALAARQDLDLDVVVLEAASRPGGKALTDLDGGWTVEWGPQTLLGEPGHAACPLGRAIRAGAVDDEVVPARPEARRRLVLWDGRLVPVPRGLRRVLGAAGLTRALAEPFVPARRADEAGADESVHAFAARRFGERVARRLVGALVTGVFAGDPERLSVASAFPRLVALEREHGSVVRALLRRGLPARAAFTFRRGVGSLTDGLARVLGPSLRLAAPAAGLAPRPGGGWRVEAPGGPLEAAAVVVATPADAAAALLRPVDAALAADLAAIPYAPVAVAALGYRAEAFADGPPRGFGFLVPRGQARVLGCIFASSISAEAAPPGHVLLRVLVGGALDPEGAALDDAALLALCRREVEPLVGARAGPTFVRLLRHPRAIPQYEVGHAARLAAIDARRRALPGLWLAGNPYRGVSVGDVVTDAERVAGEVGAALAVPRRG